MRLNRVLQTRFYLAAVITMSIAATIFTISCSGEDGPAGAAGTTCTVQPAADGTFNIVCGGSTLGTLNGGAPGVPGANGPAGPMGDACYLGDQAADGTYPVFCGNSQAGVLNGCSGWVNPSAEKDAIITCASTTFGICGTSTYSPSDYYCKVDTSSPTTYAVTPLNDVCVNGTGTSATQTKFNPLKQFCGFASRADFTAKRLSVLDLCGGDTINSAVLDASSDVRQWVYAKADGTTASYDSTKYCMVTVDQDEFADSAAIGKLALKTVRATMRDCDGTLIKPNEGSWKREYCGFAGTSSTDLKRKLVNNACADGYGPDSIAFGKEYCRMESKTSKFTTISNEFCNEGTSVDFVEKPMNQVDKATLLSPSDFKGEYCGYNSEDDFKAQKQSLLTGVCDSDGGPNDASWDNGYCQATSQTDPTTKKVGGAGAYCITNAVNTFKTAGPESRLNENTWKGEYCGYATKADFDANPKIVTRFESGICDDAVGPNSTTWENGYCQADKTGATKKVGGTSAYCGLANLAETSDATGRINENTWKSQYCGYATKADFDATPKVLSVLPGICDDGNGPNASTWENGYCQANKAGATVKVGAGVSDKLSAYCLADITDADYSVAPATARINENTWKSEYCGFSSKVNFEADVKVYSKLTGICDDGTAPNQATSSYTAWANEYCQVKEENKRVGGTTSVGGASAYCIASDDIDFTTATADLRLNEGSWKGQYCFGDKVIGVCTGGSTPISSSTLSTASPKCQ